MISTHPNVAWNPVRNDFFDVECSLQSSLIISGCSSFFYCLMIIEQRVSLSIWWIFVFFFRDNVDTIWFTLYLALDRVLLSAKWFDNCKVCIPDPMEVCISGLMQDRLFFSFRVFNHGNSSIRPCLCFSFLWPGLWTLLICSCCSLLIIFSSISVASQLRHMSTLCWNLSAVFCNSLLRVWLSLTPKTLRSRRRESCKYTPKLHDLAWLLNAVT